MIRNNLYYNMERNERNTDFEVCVGLNQIYKECIQRPEYAHSHLSGCDAFKELVNKICKDSKYNK